MFHILNWLKKKKKGVSALAQWVKNLTAGAPVTAGVQVQYSGLKGSSDRSLGLDSIPGLGTSICCRCSHKTKKTKNKNKPKPTKISGCSLGLLYISYIFLNTLIM